MIKKIKIKGLNLKFVFRHKWENTEKLVDPFKNELRLGIWAKRYKVVGTKDFSDPNKWKNNLVNKYMIGIDLIICKFWVEFYIGKILQFKL